MTRDDPTVFDLTLIIVQETERRVLMFRSFGAMPDAVARTVMFPILYLKTGIAELFQPATNWASMALVFYIGTAVLVSNVEIPARAMIYILLFSSFASLLLSVFATPSTFAFGSIKGSQIHGLANFIRSIGVDDAAKIAVLEDCLSKVAERTNARTKILLWFVATVWTVFLYIFNQVNIIDIQLSAEANMRVVSDNFVIFTVVGCVSFLIALVVVAYRKGNDAVFHRLQFAIQELKYRAACA